MVSDLNDVNMLPPQGGRLERVAHSRDETVALESMDVANSLLLIEVRKQTANVVFCDVVGGRRRVIAAERAWTPRQDQLDEAVAEAITAIERTIGRKVSLDGALIVPETDDGIGCDAIALTGDQPLHVAIIALTAVSAEAALAAIDPFVSQVARVLRLDEASEDRSDILSRIVALLTTEPPDVLVVAGGVDDAEPESAVLLGRALALAYNACPGPLPPILCATSRGVRDRLAGLLQSVDQRLVSNVIPSIRQVDRTVLREEIRQLWFEQRLSTTVTKAMGAGLRHTPLPRVEGLSRALQALATWREMPIWLVDVGDADVVVVRATLESVETASQPLAQATGHAENLLVFPDAEIEDSAWMPRPWLAAADSHGVESGWLQLVDVIARCAADIFVDSSGDQFPGLLVVRGPGLLDRLPVADAVAAAAMGIGIVGAVSVAVDRQGVLGVAGAILDTMPDAGADLIYDALEMIGTLIVGRTSDGSSEVSMTLSNPRAKGAVASAETIFAVPGVPTIVPLDARWEETVRISASPNVDVGFGTGRSGKVELADGEFGAILVVGQVTAVRRWVIGHRSRLSIGALLRGRR